MRGRSTTWTHPRQPPQRPEDERPPQEPLEVDYDPGKVWTSRRGAARNGSGKERTRSVPAPGTVRRMIVCPSCGAENPEGAKFCNECGTPLEPTEPRRKERKFATALFADLVGSTALAEREDPEVVQSVVGRTFDRLAEEIGALRGTAREVHGRRGPRGLRRPARARGRRRARRPRGARDAGGPVRAEPRVRRPRASRGSRCGSASRRARCSSTSSARAGRATGC